MWWNFYLICEQNNKKKWSGESLTVLQAKTARHNFEGHKLICFLAKSSHLLLCLTCSPTVRYFCGGFVKALGTWLILQSFQREILIGKKLCSAQCSSFHWWWFTRVWQCCQIQMVRKVWQKGTCRQSCHCSLESGWQAIQKAPEDFWRNGLNSWIWQKNVNQFAESKHIWLWMRRIACFALFIPHIIFVHSSAKATNAKYQSISLCCCVVSCQYISDKSGLWSKKCCCVNFSWQAHFCTETGCNTKYGCFSPQSWKRISSEILAKAECCVSIAKSWICRTDSIHLWFEVESKCTSLCTFASDLCRAKQKTLVSSGSCREKTNWDHGDPLCLLRSACTLCEIQEFKYWFKLKRMHVKWWCIVCDADERLSCYAPMASDS